MINEFLKFIELAVSLANYAKSEADPKVLKEIAQDVIQDAEKLKGTLNGVVR